MKFPKLLPHLVGAIAILNVPSMVSPVSTAQLERMDETAKEHRLLSQYPLALSPTALENWKSNALAWIDSWISIMQSIDLQRMSESGNKDLAHHAEVNIILLRSLVSHREQLSESSFDDIFVLETAYVISYTIAGFNYVILPVGMDIRNIDIRQFEGSLLAMRGMYHSLSVNKYFYDNYGPPKW